MTLRRWIAAVLGAPDQRALPERVRRAIRRQQESGEVLVGWLQLVIVVVFAALYAAAPKTFSPEAGIDTSSLRRSCSRLRRSSMCSFSSP
jgi:adenylate cyclase